MSKTYVDIEKIFNEFLLSMVNESNVNLIKELRHRWMEYLYQPTIPEKEENKSNDSFQWTEFLVEEFAMGFLASKSGAQIAMEQFKNDDRYKQSRCEVCGVPVKSGAMLCGEHWKHYTPKPQAENKPDRDWCILQFINKKGDHTWDYDGLNNDYVGSRHGARFPEQSLLDSRDGRSSVANGDVFINKVFRKSDGEVFSVGDVIEFGIGDFTNAHIEKFSIDSFDEKEITAWHSYAGRGYKKWKKVYPPQPQKEEQVVRMFGTEYVMVLKSDWDKYINDKNSKQ